MSSSPDKIFFGPFEVTSQVSVSWLEVYGLWTRSLGRRDAQADMVQVFLRTPHSFGLVNIKPLLPGHVLICPLKPHKRLTDLSSEEVTDLFTTTQLVQRMLARHYFTKDDTGATPAPEAGSFNIALQDGAHAGQTVPHVHVHILPRIPGATGKDPGPTDEIYERMAAEEGNVGGALWDTARPEAGGAFPRIEDASREARSLHEMRAEAELFKSVLREMSDA